MANEIIAGHVSLGRRLIRERERSLTEIATAWELDEGAFWEALAGHDPAFATLEHPEPLLPSEALAADSRNARLALGGEQAIVPGAGADGKARCGVPGCDRPHRARGYCMAHFQRLQRDGDPQVDSPLAARKQETAKACKTPGCARPVTTRFHRTALPEAGDYCPRCYRNLRDRQRRAEGRQRRVVFA